MSLNYNNYVPQPASPFIELTLINESGDKFIINKNVVEFQYVRNYVNTANTFMVKIFDQTWNSIEDRILNIYKKSNTHLKFKYGWVGHTKLYLSPNYSIKLTSIKPEFRIDGVLLTIEGISNIKPDFWAKSFSLSTIEIKRMVIRQLDKFQELRNSINMEDEKVIENCLVSPSDVVRMLARINNLNYTDESIDETLFVKQQFSSNETEPKPYIPEMKNQNYMNYIVNELIPISCGINRKPGFAMWIEDNQEKPTLYFKQIYKKTNTIRKFTYLRDKNGEVISFKPQLLGTFIGITGGASRTIHYKSDISGFQETTTYHTEKINCDGTNNIQLDKIGGNYFVIVKNNENKKDTVESTQLKTNKQSKIRTATNFIYQFNESFEAELRIVADPKLKPQQIIEVEVVSPTGKRHYSSGKYKILEISDRLSGGNIVSTLKLIRNSLLTPEQQVVWP